MRHHRTSNGRAQYGLVARYSVEWHELLPESGVRKGNDLRASPLDSDAVGISLRHVVPGMAIDFMAYYRTQDEKDLLEDALKVCRVDLELPPCATTPILRVGPGSYADMVFLVERVPEGTLAIMAFTDYVQFQSNYRSSASAISNLTSEHVNFKSIHRYRRAAKRREIHSF